MKLLSKFSPCYFKQEAAGQISTRVASFGAELLGLGRGQVILEIG